MFVLCAQAGSGLGLPSSVHVDLASAKAAAEFSAGRVLEWTEDPADDEVWLSFSPADDWMICRVPMSPREAGDRR